MTRDAMATQAIGHAALREMASEWKGARPGAVRREHIEGSGAERRTVRAQRP